MAQAKATQPKFLSPIEGHTSASSSGNTNTYVATAGGNPFDSDEEEIFSKRKMTLNVPSNCSGDLVHLIVAKNWLVCLLTAQGRYNLLRFFCHGRFHQAVSYKFIQLIQIEINIQ